MDGAFRDPQIAAREVTAYRGTVRDEELGTGEVAVEPTAGGYRLALDGLIGEAVRYELEAAFQVRSGQVLADAYRLRTLDGDAVIAVEEGRFRDVRALHWGGALVPYPRSTTPLLCCALALRGLDFERGSQRTFALWLANTVFWEVDLRVERRERVDVAAGRFDAWRVRARPSFHQIAGALDRLVGALLPPFVLHFGAEPPHRFLRFEFPTGPFRWNPRATIEATRLD